MAVRICIQQSKIGIKQENIFSNHPRLHGAQFCMKKGDKEKNHRRQMGSQFACHGLLFLPLLLTLTHIQLAKHSIMQMVFTSAAGDDDIDGGSAQVKATTETWQFHRLLIINFLVVTIFFFSFSLTSMSPLSPTTTPSGSFTFTAMRNLAIANGK